MEKADKKLNIDTDLCGQRGCFAYREGHCDCLRDTDFDGRGCPFFKSMKQYEEDLKKMASGTKTISDEDDFLAANAGFMDELAAMEAEADRIAREGTGDDTPVSDDDGWDDEGGDGDAYE